MGIHTTNGLSICPSIHPPIHQQKKNLSWNIDLQVIHQYIWKLLDKVACGKNDQNDELPSQRNAAVGTLKEKRLMHYCKP